MQDLVRGCLVACDWELGDERSFLAWKLGDVTLCRNLLQISCDQHTVRTTGNQASLR